MRISGSLRRCKKKKTRSNKGFGTETSVRIRNYSRHEWQDGNKSKTKHQQHLQQMHERSSGKPTWQDAITEVMGTVVVVLEITGGCWTVHPRNSFLKNQKTPTDPKATTRTQWVPFLSLNDCKIREREKPTTYCGALPQRETTKAGRPFFSDDHSQPVQPPPMAVTGAQQHARHRPQPHASVKFSKAKPTPHLCSSNVVVLGWK